MFGYRENLVKLWKLGGWLGFLPLVFACSRSSIEIFCFLLDEMQHKKKKEINDRILDLQNIWKFK